MRLYILITAVFLTSCVTVGNKSALNVLPAAMHSLFSRCDQGSGLISLKVIPSAFFSSSFSSEIDWNSKGKSWALESSTDLGITLVGISRKNKEIKTYGLASSQIPSLSVDKNKKLLVKKHYTGLQVNEIPCLLNGKIPVSWQQYMMSYNQNKLDWRIHFKDRHRLIILDLMMKPDGSLKKQCFNIIWKSHLGVAKHKLKVCTHELNNKKRSHLYYNDNEILKWKIFED